MHDGQGDCSYRWKHRDVICEVDADELLLLPLYVLLLPLKLE